MKKILFLVPYPLNQSPSQRFRFEQYLSLLSASGYTFHVQEFLNERNWKIIFNKGKSVQKVMALTEGFAKRLAILFRVWKFDFVFIHREATPVGPPVIEWIIVKLFQKKIIYDFDDAIWATDNRNEGRIEKGIRWRSKVKNICTWSYKVSVGNEYLGDYARQFNSNVVLNPTTIDTETLHHPHLHKKEIKANENELVIGWTGSHSTLKYLDSIVPVIQSLEKKYPYVRFLVIANKRPELNIRSLVFQPWSLATEIEDLMRMDIGIMPLPNDEWSKGKCGFKLLQYMSLNIPAVASPVGVNTKIIKHNYNGMTCADDREWILNLELLINNHDLRTSLAKTGRTTVVENYSVSSNSNNFLSLFD